MLSNKKIFSQKILKLIKNYRNSLNGVKKSNREKVEKKAAKKLAKSAARKHASPPSPMPDAPPPKMEEDVNDDYVAGSDDDIDDFDYFLSKVLTNVMSAETLRGKLLEKSSADECKVQFQILDLVKELNDLLILKKPIDLFSDQTCSLLYNKILQAQASQRFAAASWKIVAFPTLVPMVNRIFVYTSGVFHTRRIPIFFSWKISQKLCHPDIKMNSGTVEHQIPLSLVEKPTPLSENFADWFNQSSLESLDRSDREHDSSVDSGRTVQGPQIPIMNAKDVSLFETNNLDVTTTDSYLDISFLNPKRRLNLSKQDKMNILEGPSSSHSTPIRTNDPRRPRLGGAMKRQTEKLPKGQTNFLTRFLNQWFQSQISNISAELQQEIEQSAINMQD